MARQNTARKQQSRASPTGERGDRGERGDNTPEGLAAVPGTVQDPATPVAFDRLIHERVRLGIVSALAVHDALSFNDLKAALEITDGNLSVHARKLEEAGYIACTKSFEGRMPRTEYRLTDAGRAALRRYLDHMEALIHRVREG